MARKALFIEDHCLKKIPYDTWDEAESMARHVMEVSPDGKGPLGAYKCEFAEHYHYGHMRKVKRLYAG